VANRHSSQVAAVNAPARIALGLGLALAAASAALAQTVPATPGAAPTPAVQRAGDVEYLNGGAGEEERAAMNAQRAAFPLRIVFSEPGGAYVVADHVDISRGNARLLGIDKAGPLLMLRLAPGDYAIDTSYLGRTARRQVRVGAGGTQIDWRLPDEPKP
jgi:hypothetical protein